MNKKMNLIYVLKSSKNQKQNKASDTKQQQYGPRRVKFTAVCL